SSTLLLSLLLMILSTPVLAEPRSEDVPEKKRTKLGLYVTSKEAYRMWRANPLKTVLLDVRIPAEYVFVGHAPMAYNVPYQFWRADVFPADGEPVMEPNPEFLQRVKVIVGPDETILVMCRCGTRSAKACNALAAAGYKKVYCIVDGFEGDPIDDRHSESTAQRTQGGWRNTGLPWTYGLRNNLMYLPEKK
ncbi:MAG TPA: rhodanese-like domain-containing protein, partial [Thermoguttaceae bacterium]|nr:rhodanese-like domain-containing protein [Thermoguttaceae bacterium]